MGAGQSHDTSHSQPPTTALHVLRVSPSSPAARTDIEPFFDFIIGIEGAAADDLQADAQSTASTSSLPRIDVGELERVVEAHEDQSLDLVVWNSKSLDTRLVRIVPSRAWSIPPTAPVSHPKSPTSPTTDLTLTQPSLLGLSMRLCRPQYSLENVWHVMDVLDGSPAEDAGLVPFGDWIVGWSGGVLSAENDFYEVVEAHVDRPLRVYVYSYDFDTLREVVLIPNRQWGGEGLVGCVFGFGLLHRIPLHSFSSDNNIIFRGDDEDDEDSFEHTNHPLRLSGSDHPSSDQDLLFVPEAQPHPQRQGVEGGHTGMEGYTGDSPDHEDFIY